MLYSLLVPGYLLVLIFILLTILVVLMIMIWLSLIAITQFKKIQKNLKMKVINNNELNIDNFRVFLKKINQFICKKMN